MVHRDGLFILHYFGIYGIIVLFIESGVSSNYYLDVESGWAVVLQIRSTKEGCLYCNFDAIGNIKIAEQQGETHN